nr:hypothetical protein [Tanacetum cinerariifolium]
MTKLPKCSCVAKEDVLKHNQLMKLMQFLMDLNEGFQPIRSSFLSKETLPDVKDAFAIIFREESHRGMASSSSVSKPQVSRFVAKSNNWSNNGNKRIDNNKKFGNTINTGNYRGPNPNLLCKNYKKSFNANTATSSSENGTTLSFTNKQMMKLMNLINDMPSWNILANMAGRARLGHPSDQAIDVVQQDLNFTKDSKFESQTSSRPYGDGRVRLPLLLSWVIILPLRVKALSSSNLNTQRDLTENSSQKQPNVRKFSTPLKMSAKFNDYVVGSSRKYGLEKYVSYYNLSKHIYCLPTTLNKSTEPATYYDAVKYPN